MIFNLGKTGLVYKTLSDYIVKRVLNDSLH